MGNPNYVKWAAVWSNQFCKRMPSARHLRDDLRQEAWLAIVHAESKHKPGGLNLASYAHQWAFARMMVFLNRAHSHGLGASYAQMPEVVGLTVTGSDGDEYTPVWLEQSASGDQHEALEFKERMRQAGRGANVLKQRLQGYTLDEVGSTLGLSRETVRKLQTKALVRASR